MIPWARFLFAFFLLFEAAAAFCVETGYFPEDGSVAERMVTVSAEAGDRESRAVTLDELEGAEPPDRSHSSFWQKKSNRIVLVICIAGLLLLSAFLTPLLIFVPGLTTGPESTNNSLVVVNSSHSAINPGSGLTPPPVLVTADPLPDETTTVSLPHEDVAPHLLQWSDVPKPSGKKNWNIRGNDELALDGKHIRVGLSAPGKLMQRYSKAGNGIVYKFVMGGFEDNTLHKTTGAKGARCPPVSAGNQDNCKGRLELSNYFVMEGNQNANSSEQSLDITYGSKFSFSMEVKFRKPAEVIFFQLHGKPDRRLCKKDGSISLLNADDDMAGYACEQGGYPPFTLSLKKHEGRYYMLAKATSAYKDFHDKYNRCDDADFLQAAFENGETIVNRATCCRAVEGDDQDRSYVYSGAIDEYGGVKEWTNISMEILSSDYKENSPKKGYVKLWINGNMVANSETFLGRNDSSERGGGGMYYKFGIYRVTSEDPAVLVFRNIKTGATINDVQEELGEVIPATKVNGTCFEL